MVTFLSSCTKQDSSPTSSPTNTPKSILITSQFAYFRDSVWNSGILTSTMFLSAKTDTFDLTKFDSIQIQWNSSINYVDSVQTQSGEWLRTYVNAWLSVNGKTVFSKMHSKNSEMFKTTVYDFQILKKDRVIFEFFIKESNYSSSMIFLKNAAETKLYNLKIIGWKD